MLKPTKNRIIFETPGGEAISAGGIILPAARAIGIHVRSKVVAVGDKVKDILPGDICFYDNVAATNVDGGRLTIEDMVLAIIVKVPLTHSECLKPLRNWVQIEKPQEELKSREGILYWDVKGRNRFVNSRVIAVGSKVKDFGPRDIILHKNLKTIVIEEKYYFIDMDEALATIGE